VRFPIWGEVGEKKTQDETVEIEEAHWWLCARKIGRPKTGHAHEHPHGTSNNNSNRSRTTTPSMDTIIRRRTLPWRPCYPVSDGAFPIFEFSNFPISPNPLPSTADSQPKII